MSACPVYKKASCPTFAAQGLGAYVPAAPTRLAVGHTAYHHVGDLDSIMSSKPVEIARLAIIPLAAYHGYKRSRSIGWAFAWALAAVIAPFIAAPVAVAQGFGKPKGH